MLKKVISWIFLIAVNIYIAYPQIKGEPPREVPEFNPDTVFVFTSPRPLITSEKTFGEANNAWGIDLIFSNNGFGAGGFLQRNFSKNFIGYLSLYISGARNTDEFEYRFYDPTTGQIDYRVPNKVNRLYMFPLTIGIQDYIFADKLSDSFRPYINAGIGPTFILATPYSREFFEAFGYSSFYTRIAASLGIGADVGGSGSTVMCVNLRYYYIPFGGSGLESIKDNPIKNFGGIFLSLSLGMRY